MLGSEKESTCGNDSARETNENYDMNSTSECLNEKANNHTNANNKRTPFECKHTNLTSFNAFRTMLLMYIRFIHVSLIKFRKKIFADKFSFIL